MSKKSNRFNQKKSVIRVFLFICLALFVFGVFVTVSQSSFAQSSQQQQLGETYRDKKYKGAQDEEELKVQKNIQTSESNKKKKSNEADEGF
ncbi:MAG: hypothetical protein ACK41T_03890 [Pseudobdellovibrio sp.]